MRSLLEPRETCWISLLTGWVWSGRERIEVGILKRRGDAAQTTFMG